MLVEYNTYADVRFQLSYAVKQLKSRPANTVIDGFQRNARKMWKPNLSADNDS